MRRFPSSWSTVLAQLGFKRTNRKKSDLRHRRSRIETLEVRALLASDILVTTLADDFSPDVGEVSLRDAIYAAKTDGENDHDVITFDASLFANGPATIRLGDSDGNGVVDPNDNEVSTQLSIDSDLTIQGPGSEWLKISGDQATRVFSILPSFDVTMSGLTIADGYLHSHGAGIYNQSNLTLEQVVVRDNTAIETAQFQGGQGGGLYHRYGQLTIKNSTFTNNVAALGGAIRLHLYSSSTSDASISGTTFVGNHALNLREGSSYANGAAMHIQGSYSTTTISNSTFSGNSAASYGGAFQIATGANVDIINSTVTQNHAGTRGGGITSGSGTHITVHNSIIASNTSGTFYPDINIYDSSVIQGESANNLIGVNSRTNFDPVKNPLIGQDPKLAPLGDYGGPTLTHALLPGSPAIDQGNISLSVDANGNEFTADQRGSAASLSTRMMGESIDLGAFEYGAQVIDIEEPFDLTAGYEVTSPWDSWVATNRRGASVITWRGTGPEGYGIYVQQINPNSEATSLPRLVSLGQPSQLVAPRVVVDGQGRYAVAWQEGYNTSAKVWMRRYTATGSPIDDLPVNITGSSQISGTPSIVASEAGEIVVVWKDGTGNLVFRRYSMSGNSLDGAPRTAVVGDGSPLKISSSGRTAAILPDGSFFLQWTEGTNVYVQRFSSAGIATGERILAGEIEGDLLAVPPASRGLNWENTYRNLFALDIAQDPSGGIVIALLRSDSGELYDSYDETYVYQYESRIVGRKINLEGELGEEFEVAAGSDLYESASPSFGNGEYYWLWNSLSVIRPSLAVDSAGRVGAAWSRSRVSEFDSFGYDLDEFGNPVYSENASHSDWSDHHDLEIGWFDSHGEKLLAEPYRLGEEASESAHTPSLAADELGRFLLTSIHNNQLTGQRFSLAQPVSLDMQGTLRVDDTAMQYEDLRLSAKLVDGQRMVALNGVATTIPASAVKKIEIRGGANDSQIDLSRVDAEYFTGLLPWTDLAGTPSIEVYAGGGNDAIIGSPLGGWLDGGEGDDRIVGKSRWDAGADGGAGAFTVNKLVGGEGDDLLSGGDGNDELQGGTGNDSLQGGGGDDKLYGGEGDDQLFGQAGSDDLFGDAGDDRLDGGVQPVGETDSDELDGSLGSDLYFVTQASAATITITDGESNQGDADTIDFSAATLGIDLDLNKTTPQGLFAGTATITLAANNQIENVIGTAQNDVITGNALNNRLEGGAGDDTLKGGLGENTLLGQAGEDTLHGSLGTNTLEGGLDDDDYIIDEHQGNAQVIDATGTDKAKWTFGSLTTGDDYDIYVQWRASVNEAELATIANPYQVAGVTANLGLEVVENAVTLGLLGDGEWRRLVNPADPAGRFSAASSELVVELADLLGEGAEFAGAMKVVRHNLAPNASITAGLDGNGVWNVASGTSISVTATDSDSSNLALLLKEPYASRFEVTGVSGAWTVSAKNPGTDLGEVPLSLVINDQDPTNPRSDEITLLVRFTGNNNAPAITGLSLVSGAPGNDPDSFVVQEISFDPSVTNAPLTIDVIATADSNETLTYSLSPDAPVGAGFDPSNPNRFTWTPSEDQDGEHTFDIYVTDNGTPPIRVARTITVLVEDRNEKAEIDNGSFVLVHNTGSTANNATADATLTGTVTDDESLSFVEVVIDLGYDGNSFAIDDYASLVISDDDPTKASFTYAPTMSQLESYLSQGVTTVTIAARTREWMPDESEYRDGNEIRQITIEPGLTDNTPPSIVAGSFGLKNDTGLVPGTTVDATLVGQVSHPDGAQAGLTVKIYDSDPTVTNPPDALAEVTTEEEGSFAWSPTTVTPGTVFYAVVEERPQLARSSAEYVSSTVAMTVPITLEPQRAASVSELSFSSQTGPVFHGQLAPANGFQDQSLAGVTIQYATTTLGQAQSPSFKSSELAGSTVADESGAFRIILPDLSLNDTGKLWVRAVGWDTYQNKIMVGAPVGEDFTVALPDQTVLPTIVPQNVTGDFPGGFKLRFDADNDGVVQDPTVVGLVTSGGEPLANAVVEFFESPTATQPLGAAVTNSLGQFEFTPIDLDPGQATEIYARPRQWNPWLANNQAQITPDRGWIVGDYLQLREGEPNPTITLAETLDLSLAGPLELLYDTGTVTSLPAVKGTVVYAGEMADVVVKLRYEAVTGTVIQELIPSSDGSFTHWLEGLPPVLPGDELPTHLVDVRLRAPDFTSQGPEFSDPLLGDDGTGNLTPSGYLDFYDFGDETTDPSLDDATASEWFTDLFSGDGLELGGQWYDSSFTRDWKSQLDGHTTAWNRVDDQDASDWSVEFTQDPAASWNLSTTLQDPTNLDLPRTEFVNPTIAGVLNIGSAAVAGVTVEFYLDGLNGPLDGTAVTDTEGKYTYVPTSYQVDDGNGVSNNLVIKAIAPQSVSDVEAELQPVTAIVYSGTFIVLSDDSLPTPQLSLKSPTGTITASGGGEIPTAVNPTIVGKAELGDADTVLRIEYDTNHDGIANGFTYAGGNGEFELVPEWTTPPSGETTVAVRVGKFQSDQVGDLGYTTYGAWETITWHVVANVAPTITTLELANDTGARDANSGGWILDRVTSDPTLVGQVTDADSTHDAYVTVEFDHNGDDEVDGTASTDAEGRFRYTPSGIGYGDWNIRARVSEFDPVTATELFVATTGVSNPTLEADSWHELQGPGTITGFSGFTLVEADLYGMGTEDGSNESTFKRLNASQTNYDPRLTGQIVADPQGQAYPVEGVVVDFFDGLLTIGSATTDADGRFDFLPSGLEFGSGKTITAIPRQSERVDASVVSAMPGFDSPPINFQAIASFTATVSAQEAQPDFFTLPITGTITEPAGVAAQYVELQIDSGPVEIIAIETELQGTDSEPILVYRHEIDLRPFVNDSNFDFTIKVRPVGVDDSGFVFGNWSLPTTFDASDVDYVPLLIDPSSLINEQPNSPEDPPLVRPVVTGTLKRLPSTFNDAPRQTDDEAYVVEFDYNGDGVVDDSLFLDDTDLTTAGNDLPFRYELQGLSPGNYEIAVRYVASASYLSTDSSGESTGREIQAVEGDWQPLTIDFVNPGPKIVTDSVALEEPTYATITGTIEDVHNVGAIGLTVEIDENLDGYTDGIATILNGEGDAIHFTYTLQNAVVGALDFQVRAVDSLTDSQQTLEGEWLRVSNLILESHDLPTVNADSLRLETNEYLGSDPDVWESSNPVITGTATFVEVATLRRVEFDVARYNEATGSLEFDGLVDGSTIVDTFGSFSYAAENLSHGEQRIRIRAVAQVGSQQLIAPWSDQPDGDFIFFHQLIDEPVVNNLRAVNEERGILEGRVTSEGYGVAATVSFDLGNGDGVTRQVTTNQSGYFRYEVPQLAAGTHVVSVTAAVDDPRSVLDVTGETRSISLNYEPLATFVPPSLDVQELGLAYAVDDQGTLRANDPTIRGLVANPSPQLLARIELTNVSDPSDTMPFETIVFDDGTFSMTAPAGLTDGQTYSVSVTLIAWNPRAETAGVITGAEVTSSNDNLLTFTLDSQVDSSPALGRMRRIDSGGDLAAQQQSDPHFYGLVAGWGPRGGYAIKFDHNGDGVADGQTFSRGDGTFTYIAAGVESGDLTQTMTAWAEWTDYWGNERTGTPTSSSFVLTSVPIVSEVEYGETGGTLAPGGNDVTPDKLVVSGFYNRPNAALLVEYQLFGQGAQDSAALNSSSATYHPTQPRTISATTDANGHFEITVDELEIIGGSASAVLRVVDVEDVVDLNDPADYVTNAIASPWQTKSFFVGDSTVIHDFQLAHNTGDENDSLTSDPTVEGIIGGGLAHGLVEITVTGTGITEDLQYRTSADASGQFSFTPTSLSIGGNYSISAATVGFDPATGQEVFGTATSLVSFILADPEGAASVSLVLKSTGDPINPDNSLPIVEDPTVVGSVVKDNGGRVSGLRVEFDIIASGFDEEIDGFAFTDADGNFEFTPLGLVAGVAVGIRARVVDWNYQTHEFVAGTFSVPVEFELSTTATTNPALDDDLLDDEAAAELAFAEARRAIILAIRDADTLDGNDTVTAGNEAETQFVTGLGTITPLHRGGVHQDDELEQVFDYSSMIASGFVNRNSNGQSVTRGSNDDLTSYEYAFYRGSYDGDSFLDMVTISLPVIDHAFVTEEVADGTTTKTTTEILGFYSFSFAAAGVALGNYITDGSHYLTETLEYDYRIEVESWPTGGQASSTKTVAAGDYEFSYSDGDENDYYHWLYGGSASSAGSSTLSSGSPQQAFSYTETINQENWIDESDSNTTFENSLSVTETSSIREHTLYREKTTSTGTIASNSYFGQTINATITTDAYALVDRETTDTQATTSGLSSVDNLENSSDSLTQQLLYEGWLYSEVDSTDGEETGGNFTLRETATSSFTQSGSGSVQIGTPSIGTNAPAAGRYSLDTWNYGSEGSSSSNSQLVGYYEVDGDSTFVEATVFESANVSVEGAGGSSTTYDDWEGVGETKESDTGSGNTHFEYESSAYSTLSGRIVGVNDDLTYTGTTYLRYDGSGKGNATIRGVETSLSGETEGPDAEYQKTIANYELRSRSEDSSGGSLQSGFTTTKQGTTSDGGFNSYASASSVTASQSFGTIQDYGVADGDTEPSVQETVPFRFNETVQASLSASIGGEFYVPITGDTISNGDANRQESLVIKSTELVGLASEDAIPRDSGETESIDPSAANFSFTKSQTTTSDQEDYTFDIAGENVSKRGDFTSRTTHNTESIFQAAGGSGDEDTDADNDETFAWKLRDDSGSNYTSSLDGAFAEYDLDGVVTRTADADTEEEITSFASSFSGSKGTSRYFEQRTEEGASSGSIEVTEHGNSRGRNTTRTKSRFTSSTTGFVSLVDDEVTNASLTTTFDTFGSSTTRSKGNGTGTVVTIEGVETVTSDSTFESRYRVSGNSSSKGTTTVTTTGGETSSLTRIDNASQSGTLDDFSKVVGNVTLDDPNKNVTSTSTVTTDNNGMSSASSSGQVITDAAGTHSSFSVESSSGGSNIVTTDWSEVTTIGAGTQTNLGKSRDTVSGGQTFDGRVSTDRGGRDRTTGSYTNESTVSDFQASLSEWQDDSGHYWRNTATVDQSNTVKNSGSIESDHGESLATPNGDPTVTGTGGYQYDHESGWREYTKDEEENGVQTNTVVNDTSEEGKDGQGEGWKRTGSQSGGFGKPEKETEGYETWKNQRDGATTLDSNSETGTSNESTLEDGTLRQTNSLWTDNYLKFEQTGDLANGGQVTTRIKFQNSRTDQTATASDKRQSLKITSFSISGDGTNIIGPDTASYTDRLNSSSNNIRYASITEQNYGTNATTTSSYSSSHSLGEYGAVNGTFSANNSSNTSDYSDSSGSYDYEVEGDIYNAEGNTSDTSERIWGEFKTDLIVSVETTVTENGSYHDTTDGRVQSGSYDKTTVTTRDGSLSDEVNWSSTHATWSQALAQAWYFEPEFNQGPEHDYKKTTQDTDYLSKTIVKGHYDTSTNEDLSTTTVSGHDNFSQVDTWDLRYFDHYNLPSGFQYYWYDSEGKEEYQQLESLGKDKSNDASWTSIEYKDKYEKPFDDSPAGGSYVKPLTRSDEQQTIGETVNDTEVTTSGVTAGGIPLPSIPSEYYRKNNGGKHLGETEGHGVFRSFFGELGKQVADLVTDEIPYLGQAKAADKLINDRNLVTGEENLGGLDRASSTLDLVPGGSTVKRATKGIGNVAGGLFRLAKNLLPSSRTTDTAGNLANEAMKKASDLVPDAAKRLDDQAAKSSDKLTKQADAAEPEVVAPKTNKHHSDPKFLGGDPKQPTTTVTETGHRQLHKDLNDHLRTKTDAAGNHMRPQRGNPGKRIQEKFTRQERLEATAEFYKNNRDKYPDSARDFFKQHPGLE